MDLKIKDRIYTGREVLTTNLLPSYVKKGASGFYGGVEITSETIAKDLNLQLPRHIANRKHCYELLNYYKGQQPILYEHDENRIAEDKTVINFAHAISRNITSYTYSGGVQYVGTSPEYSDDVKVLNDYMKINNKATISKEVQDYQSICGTGYMSIQSGDFGNTGSPFTLGVCSPTNTFVVYSIFNPSVPVYACVYYKNKIDIYNTSNDFNRVSQYVYQVYTANEIYLFTGKTLKINAESNSAFQLEPGYPVSHILGDVPIVEFPNNSFRIGDFEVAVSLLNAINKLASDCLYNISSVVTSYLVLLGVDKDSLDTEQMKKNRVMALPGAEGVTQDAKFIYAQLDGTGTSLLRNYLESALKFIVGVPDRDSGQTGSDTGAAAELRTGQGDIEVVAKTKALYSEAAERRLLNMAVKILKAKNLISETMKGQNVDVEITRINRADILSKTQSMLNMYQMGMDKEDIIYFGNITNDVTNVAARWEKAEAEKIVDESVSGNSAGIEDKGVDDVGVGNA